MRRCRRRNPHQETALSAAAGRLSYLFGFTGPSMSIDTLHTTFAALAAEGSISSYEETFRGPPLPSGDTADAVCGISCRSAAASRCSRGATW